MNLKRAVQPQMNTDEHRLAAYCRATPPHPQGERFRRGLPQCLSVSIGGFSVSTAVFRFKLPSKKWRDLSLRVCQVDPLGCPSYFNSSFILSAPPRTTIEGGLVPGTGPRPPGLPRIALLLAHGLAARPLPPAHALGAGAKPPETQQRFPVEVPSQVWQDGVALNDRKTNSPSPA